MRPDAPTPTGIAARLTIASAVIAIAVIALPSPAAAATAPSFAPARARLEVGADFGPMNGFQIRPEFNVQTWRRGALSSGMIFSLHVHDWRDADHEPEGLEYSGREFSARLAATAGPTLFVPSRIFGVGFQAHVGAVFLDHESRIVDDAHDLDLRSDHTSVWFELGASISARFRFHEHVGATVDVTIPLWIAGTSLLDGWAAVQAPTVGVRIAALF